MMVRSTITKRGRGRERKRGRGKQRIMNSSLEARSEANEFIRENCGPAAKGLAFDQLLLPLCWPEPNWKLMKSEL